MCTLRYLTLPVLVLLLACSNTFAQSSKILEGVLFRKGTATRISNASILNKRARYSVLSNNLGTFTLVAMPGDTLQISHPEYLSQELIVSNQTTLVIHLQPVILLKEAIVKGESPQQRLAEAEASFRKKGIYYKGKPPLKLLLPFGGSPATFFYELLSKDGRRARRFGEFAQSEADYYEVAARFNDYNIRRITSISDEELPDFKSAYWPSAEQMRNWNEFDLLHYIKTSYIKFKARPLDTLQNPAGK